MENSLPPVLRKLIKEFSRMPGIGVRSAERIAFHILKCAEEDAVSLARAIVEVKNKVRSCRVCNNFSQGDICSICSDHSRDRGRICVVNSPSGVMAMEKSGSYKGLYHILLGELSPIDGVEPGDLKIKELLERLKKGNIEEVILATDFTTEGETTALFLQEILKGKDVKVTRLARGVPVGASLEYADVATLQRAFEERRA